MLLLLTLLSCFSVLLQFMLGFVLVHKSNCYSASLEATVEFVWTGVNSIFSVNHEDQV